MEHRGQSGTWYRQSAVLLLFGLIMLNLDADSMWPSAGPSRVVSSTAQTYTLGKVRFPTSCAPSVQKQIEEGVALLHSFQYKQAESMFTLASNQEPHCAMAYWGKAMSLYEQLWGWPDERAFARGRADMEIAETQTAVTPRERAYVDVTRTFFQVHPGWGQNARMEAFSIGWENLCRRFPSDIEAGAFYGLSLVALAEVGVDESANRKKAIAVLCPLFRAAPDDPGPAHYLIHAADTPELATRALDAARQYASIAPDSAHALHMPSHIFVRLGLWREAIQSNLASERSAADATRSGTADMHYQIHAMDFLQYCYLQAGDETAARQLTEDLTRVPGATAYQIANYQSDFRARAALELHQWKEAESLAVPNLEPRARENAYYVRAIGAAHNGDVAQAQNDLAELEAVVATLHAENTKKGPASNDDDIRVKEVQAWIAFAQNHVEEAVRILRAASGEDAKQVESLSMPAREMLADLLLACQRPFEALGQYELALKLTPNRFDSLNGAAHAAKFAGQPNTARKYFGAMLAVSVSSANRAELREAREYVARK